MAQPVQPNDFASFLDTDSTLPRCLYRGRVCEQPRDTKLNGEPHRLCRMHRLRHNHYQRNSQRRRERMGQRSNAANISAWKQVAWRGALDATSNDDDIPSDEELLSCLRWFLTEPDVPLVEYQVIDVLTVDDVLALDDLGNI